MKTVDIDCAIINYNTENVLLPTAMTGEVPGQAYTMSATVPRS